MSHIQIPFRDRSAPLSTVSEAARVLSTDEDRTVVRQLVLDARLDGLATAGDLLDRFDQLDPPGRRQLVDQARTACGLEPLGQREAQQRSASGLTVTARPQTELRRRHDGTFYEVPLREGRWAVGPSGQPVDLNDLEDRTARQRAEEDSERAKRDALAADRAADAAAAGELARAREAQHQAELPTHLR